MSAEQGEREVSTRDQVIDAMTEAAIRNGRWSIREVVSSTLDAAIQARNIEGGSALIDWLVDNAGDEWWDEVVGLAVDAQLPGSDKSQREPRDVLAVRIETWAEGGGYDFADRLLRDLDEAGFQIVFRITKPESL